MAKFFIESLGSGGTATGAEVRFGALEIGGNSFRLPGFFIHTLSGSVPHLTSEVFEMVFAHGSHPLQISIDNTFPFHENVKPSGKTISQFVGLPKSPSFLSVHNPLQRLLPGYNDKFGISIWTRQGRKTLSVSKFIEIVNDFQPALFQVLSDYDVKSTSSIKRSRKSTARNIEYLNQVLSETKEESGAFATIETAWFRVNQKDAESALTEILEKQSRLSGFVINGVSGASTDVGIGTSVLSNIISKLPPNKLRYVPGEFTFWEILDLVREGIDLVDSSTVTRAAEDGHAFCLQLAGFLTQNDYKAISNESLPAMTAGVGQVTEEPYEKVVSPKKLRINLKDRRYFDDFSPISTTCNCYTCRKFTKAYIHHLLSTSELLGPVLLMMHNLEEFERFFEAVRYTLLDEKKFTTLHAHLKNDSKIELDLHSAQTEVEKRIKL